MGIKKAVTVCAAAAFLPKLLSKLFAVFRVRGRRFALGAVLCFGLCGFVRSARRFFVLSLFVVHELSPPFGNSMHAHSH